MTKSNCLIAPKWALLKYVKTTLSQSMQPYPETKNLFMFGKFLDIFIGFLDVTDVILTNVIK